MHEAPNTEAIAALVCLIEARSGASAVAMCELREDACRVAVGTSLPHLPGAMPARGGEDTWHDLEPGVRASLAGRRAVRIDPARLGYEAGGCMLYPIATPPAGPDFCLAIITADTSPVDDGTDAALRDGAVVLSALLHPETGARSKNPALIVPADILLPQHVPQRRREATASVPQGRSWLTGSILPHAAAHRRIDAALRAQEDAPASLMMLDLDRFRAVNEALGSAAGDALLAVIAARLDTALANADSLVRLDGDRFVLVTTRPRKALDGFAQQLLDRISQPLTLAGQTVAMQACVGIVASVDRAMPVPVLLTRADTALRRAKSEGQRRIVAYEPRLDTAALERSQLELELASAPANGQMQLVYQPYVELETGRVSGVEALMRWTHPKRGAVQPSTFIPLAEATGQILALGSWALLTACRAALNWPTATNVSVNISALQFHEPGFVEEVGTILAAANFPAERLELEITETVLMRDNPETVDQLNRLIDMGIRIALDDFGTGYSALAYLGRLPHHRIKLDRSFVRDLANPATADLIRAIISTARSQNIAITAEGVEEIEQVEVLRAMGFTHVQGYATGRPMPNPVAAFAEGPTTQAI